MSAGTQPIAAPPNAQDQTLDPGLGTDPSTLDLETLLAIPPFAGPPESPRSAGLDAGRPDLTSLSLDELLSLSITGDLTDLETAGDEEEGAGVGRRGPWDDGAAPRGDPDASGQHENDGLSRPMEGEGGAQVLDPNLGQELIGSLIGQDVQIYLDHMA